MRSGSSIFGWGLEKGNINFDTKDNRIILCGTNFAYYAPCEKLKTLISNYTVTFPDKEMISDNYTIVPHGCATLVFTDDGTDIRGQLFGPMSSPCVVGKSANVCRMIFIMEFQPAGLFAFTGRKQDEWKDKVVAFECVNAFLDSSLKDILIEVNSVAELLRQTESLLLRNWNNEYPVEFNTAVRLIIEHGGNILAREISNSVFYSERHLNRLFHLYLGFNMKHFSRIVRINHSIQLLTNKCNSLVYVYSRAGFYDMPHFIKDFRLVCGITPDQYRRNMSDFYSEIAKF